ncbi:hypothetical protein [Desulfurivibrio alkaliphilus]|uniref:Uncharacterized protein n=1 Tax=Desulfurivibrio alkaliphilus (strain DSM 19089 / UNIQEM U267 / AHT2) TaxID=589865 RepID=D6Z0H2_DESAT|nr:hypothetical protein [Desulfurivibrio alkaliphilus]ADH85201.1 hypothetical protein DaAHT2_0495 [Desulfurivibrio alkaliphilus AHT 2]
MPKHDGQERPPARHSGAAQGVVAGQWQWWRWFVVAAVSHPLQTFVAWYLLLGLGMSWEVSTNTYQVWPVPFGGLLALITAARLGLFLALARYAFQIFDRGGLSGAFLRNHRWSLPCLPITFLLGWPMELNVFGFVYFPVLLVAILIFGGLVLALNLRTLIQARRSVAAR